MFYPLPANNGVKMRTWAVMRALAAEGHELTLATFANPAQANGHSAELFEVCRHVECVPRALNSLSSSADYWGRLRGVFSSLPYGVLQARSEEMERCILSLVRNRRFDAVVSEQADPLINLPRSVSVPVILDNQNVDHIILQRYISFERNPAKKSYACLECWKTMRWQREACRRSALALACSDFDRTAIQSFAPQVPVIVAPNIVDTDHYQPSVAEQPYTVLYQGGMDWYPNRDAVEFFTSAIWPKIRALVPEARFVVGGRSPSDEFRRRFAAVPRLEFTGTVPDMRAEIAKASVCVVPLRIGSGTRLKILEAAAMAKPIVSTRVGAEGLDFVDGEEIVLADQPEAFAPAVAALLTDPARRQRLGDSARRRVEVQYGLPALRAALRTALEKLRGQPGEPRCDVVAHGVRS
jgi:glycosyltransferase involved in cell wall biosynthesis